MRCDGKERQHSEGSPGVPVTQSAPPALEAERGRPKGPPKREQNPDHAWCDLARKAEVRLRKPTWLEHSRTASDAVRSASQGRWSDGPEGPSPGAPLAGRGSLPSKTEEKLQVLPPGRPTGARLLGRQPEAGVQCKIFPSSLRSTTHRILSPTPLTTRVHLRRC